MQVLRRVCSRWIASWLARCNYESRIELLNQPKIKKLQKTRSTLSERRIFATMIVVIGWKRLKAVLTHGLELEIRGCRVLAAVSQITAM